MKKIGLVVAVETEAVGNRYGKPVSLHRHGSIEVSEYRVPAGQLFVCHTGMGEIAAAAGTQLLISLYGAEMILNYGVVGGLTGEMKIAKTCVVEKAVHYDMDTSPIDPVVPGQYLELPDVYLPADPELVRKALLLAPELKPVICASGDKFVEGAAQKEALHQAWNAEICDMESAAVILTSFRNQVPCLLLKTVSDAVEGGAEDFVREKLRASTLCLSIMDQILEGLG